MSLRFISSTGVKRGRENDFLLYVKGLPIELILYGSGFCSGLCKEGSSLSIQAFAVDVTEIDEFLGVACVHADNTDPSAFPHLKMIFCELLPPAECGWKFMAVSKCGQKIAVLAFVPVAKPGYIPMSGHTKQPSLFHCGEKRIPPEKVQHQFRGLRNVSGKFRAKKEPGRVSSPAFLTSCLQYLLE